MSDRIPSELAELLKQAHDIGEDIGKEIQDSNAELIENGDTRIITEMPGVDRNTIEIESVSETKAMVLGKTDSNKVYIGQIEYKGSTEIKNITEKNGIYTIYL